MFLSICGNNAGYLPDKPDFFDVTGLLIGDAGLREVFPLKDVTRANQIILNQHNQIEALECEVRELAKNKQEILEPQPESTETLSLYDQVKTKYDRVLQQKTEIADKYESLKTKSDLKDSKFSRKTSILYYYKSKRTTIKGYKSVIKTGLFDETDPLVVITHLTEDIQDQKQLNYYYQNTLYDLIAQRRRVEVELRRCNRDVET